MTLQASSVKDQVFVAWYHALVATPRIRHDTIPTLRVLRKAASTTSVLEAGQALVGLGTIAWCHAINWWDVEDSIQHAPLVALLPWNQSVRPGLAGAYVSLKGFADTQREAVAVVGLDMKMRNAIRLLHGRGMLYDQLGRTWLKMEHLEFMASTETGVEIVAYGGWKV